MAKITQKNVQIFIFQLAGNYFGGEIEYINESMYFREDITKVPTTNPFLLGVINQRGNVIPIIFINKFLSLEPTNPDSQSTIIVLQHQKLQVGIVTNSVAEIITVSEDEIEPANTENPYIKAVLDKDDRLVSILNIPQLLIDTKKQVV